MVQVLGYPWLSKARTELSVLVSACLQLLDASLLLSTLQVGYRCEGLWFHFGVGGRVYIVVQCQRGVFSMHLAVLLWYKQAQLACWNIRQKLSFVFLLQCF